MDPFPRSRADAHGDGTPRERDADQRSDRAGCTFNIGISGAPTKLVGGDSGRVEREEIADEFLISPPSE